MGVLEDHGFDDILRLEGEISQRVKEFADLEKRRLAAMEMDGIHPDFFPRADENYALALKRAAFNVYLDCVDFFRDNWDGTRRNDFYLKARQDLEIYLDKSNAIDDLSLREGATSNIERELELMDVLGQEGPAEYLAAVLNRRAA